MSFKKNAVLLGLVFAVFGVRAGVDIAAPVQKVQIAADGSLWFAMDTVTTMATYCKAGWNGLTMYIPKDNPSFPYYYATLTAALLKGKSVFIGNISFFNGTTSCDVTQTGFGLTLVQ